MKRIMGNQLEKEESKSSKKQSEKEQEKKGKDKKNVLTIDDDDPELSKPADSTATILYAFDDSEMACITSLVSSLPSEKHDVDTRNARLVARWEANRRVRLAGWEAALAKLTLGANWLTRYSELLLGLCPLAFASEAMWQDFVRELLEILRAEGLTGWVALRGSSTTFLSLHPEKGCDPDATVLAQHYTQGGEDGLRQYLGPTGNNANSLSNSAASSNGLAPTPSNALHFFDCKVHRLGGPVSAKQKLKEYQLFEAFSDLDFNIKSPELINRLKANGAHVSGADVGGNYNQDDTFDELPGLWTLKADWTAKLQRDISFVSIASEKDVNAYSSHPFTFPI